MPLLPVTRTLVIAIAAAAGLVLAADTPPPPTQQPAPGCPPGHVNQHLTWPDGRHEVICARLPPCPSHDY